MSEKTQDKSYNSQGLAYSNEDKKRYLVIKDLKKKRLASILIFTISFVTFISVLLIFLSNLR